MNTRRQHVGLVTLSVLLLLEVALAIVLMCAYVSAQQPRRVPMTVRDVPAKPPSTRFRLRCANVQMMPVQCLTRNKMDKSALFQDVDVLMLQEAFRVPAGVHADPIDLLHVWAPGTRMTYAVASTPLHAWLGTDSGLAAAALSPWQCTFVATKTFTHSQHVDSMASKAVVVFQISGGVRIANMHLQASYTYWQVPADDRVRTSQFLEAVEFAVAHGAVLLVGDANVDTDATLATFDSIVERAGGRRVPDDGQSTCPSVGSGMAAWRQGEDAGKRVDYMWILDNSQLACDGMVTTDRAITDPWSDHAAIEAEFTILC